jgi:hypothetical protein
VELFLWKTGRLELMKNSVFCADIVLPPVRSS